MSMFLFVITKISVPSRGWSG